MNHSNDLRHAGLHKRRVAVEDVAVGHKPRTMRPKSAQPVPPAVRNPPIEDLINQRADEEHARQRLTISFAPLYAFMATIAHTARMDERQAILDTLPKDRAAGQSADWNAGYDAAMVAIVRAAVMRSHTH